MSPLAEEIGSTAREAVKSVGSNPSCLAAILLAGIFAFLTYLAAQREAERYNSRIAHAMALLDKCIVDAKAGGK